MLKITGESKGDAFNVFCETCDQEVEFRDIRWTDGQLWITARCPDCAEAAQLRLEPRTWYDIAKSPRRARAHRVFDRTMTIGGVIVVAVLYLTGSLLFVRYMEFVLGVVLFIFTVAVALQFIKAYRSASSMPFWGRVKSAWTDLNS